MMRKSSLPIWLLSCALAILIADAPAKAGSDAELPEGWQDWPVVKKGAIPDNQTAIPSDLPAILQETVKTYNWVGDGKGSAYQVRVHPDKLEAYNAGAQSFDDGPTAILDLTGIKVIFVTEHLVGEPLYGTFSYGGDDITQAHPSLAPETCTACHSGYAEFCGGGLCSR